MLAVLRPFSTGRNFPRGVTFLVFKYELAESGRQNTKENIIPRGKFCLVENDLYADINLFNWPDANFTQCCPFTRP